MFLADPREVEFLNFNIYQYYGLRSTISEKAATIIAECKRSNI